MIDDPEIEAQPIGSAFKAVVERAIAGCEDPAERKLRIMIARHEGLFSEQEAADWLKLLGLEAA